MRTQLVILGLCGLLLASVPEIVPQGRIEAKQVNTKRANTKQVKTKQASTKQPHTKQVKTKRVKTRQVGLASWYGKRHQGRRTASGERFSRRQLTAAHRSLPLGTKVKVTNLRTKQQVIVEINDRGPYTDKQRHIIDLSEAAAERLGMREHGVERVEIVVVEPAS